jgi:flagellar basal body P-ring formation protein FlgA
MTIRTLLFAAALASCCTSALAQSDNEVIAGPVLRPSVTVTGDVVRIGDVIDNAGTAAQIAIYRAPDLGTTGSLQTSQVLATLRNYQVIGVDTRDIREVSVTRLSRTLSQQEVEQQITRSLEHRSGLGDAANISITFDRDLRTLQLDSSNTGDMQAVSTRYDARSGRFDVMFEIANAGGSAPTRLRFTGTAIETVEAAILARGVERNEVLKSSDVVIERRPKAEVGTDAVRRDRAVGMQTRKAMRSGQVLRMADIAKPDLVQHDQNVTLIYATNGLYLTMRAKAVDSGSEGDSVTVINTQSKRTVQGVVTGPGQVTVSVPQPVATAAATPANQPTAPSKTE